MVRVQPDERYGARGRGPHGGQRQHVLRRAQLLGQAPRLHGRRDPVRVGHLVVHGAVRAAVLSGLSGATSPSPFSVGRSVGATADGSAGG